MLSIEEARSKILEHVSQISAETVDLLQAQDRILRESIRAPWDFPRFDYSAMDGYAVRAQDLEGASDKNPIRLRVSQEVRASQWSEESLQAGECARIFTGAAIPPGADAVVMQENVSREEEHAIFLASPPVGESIRARGGDLREGTNLLQAGDFLGAGEIGLLASINRSFVTVSRRPRVAILSCGDELVDIHERPTPGKIVESNRFALYAQVKAVGGDPQMLPLVPDDADALRQQLREGLKADILLTSGGVSVGDYDLIRPILEELGVQIHLWKIAIKPGKPVVFGTHRHCLIFGLPGNPVSSMVTFDLFVRPAIGKMLQTDSLELPSLMATLTQPAYPTRKRTHLVRGQLKSTEEGLFFSPYTSQSSGNLLGMRRINALAKLPPGTENYPTGSRVEVLLLPQQPLNLPPF